MGDFTSGHITSEEAAEIVHDLGKSLASDDITLYNGVSYRHIMVWHARPHGYDPHATPRHQRQAGRRAPAKRSRR